MQTRRVFRTHRERHDLLHKKRKKKIAVEPCEEFFVYDFLNDISGKNWELLKMEKKA